MTTKPLQGRKVGPQVLGRAEGEVGRWGGGGGGGQAVKCTEGGEEGGRASGTAELQRFTYPRVYRQLNEAQLGMQFLPLGHFLQRKCEVQPDRRGERRKHRKRGTEEVRKKGGKTEQWNKSRRNTVKRGSFSLSGSSCFRRYHAGKATGGRCHTQSWAGGGQRSSFYHPVGPRFVHSELDVTVQPLLCVVGDGAALSSQLSAAEVHAGEIYASQEKTAELKRANGFCRLRCGSAGLVALSAADAHTPAVTLGE